MRLAINLRLYVKGQIGGMENYVRHIINGIARHQELTGDTWTVFALESELDHIREFAPGARLIAVTHVTADADIRRELDNNSYDLLFCPLLVLEPLRSRIPSVITIPDLQHEFFPEFFEKDTLSWRMQTFQPSVFHSDVTFTISEYSKSTIVKKYGADPEKVIVVGLDVDPEFRSSPSPEAQRGFRELGLPNRYIYFPANFWRHKNHLNLLKALRLLVDNGYRDLSLVLTGAPSTGMDRVKADVSQLKLDANVRLLGYQPRGVIAELYRHAQALAFTSLFEGFGIPILEAFHVGTPVVTAGSTSCPEIAGDAALLVDERDPASIAAALRRVLDSEGLRNELVARGKQRTLQYSWDDAVALTLETFQRVASRKVTSPRVEEYPTVSIVTPTYNMGHFLEETIQSVLSQDYPHIDYVVMDGGSSDGTMEILRKYEGRLRYHSGPDGGQAAAINLGFTKTRGDVFTFLNADDTYLPGAVGTAVRQLVANRNVGAVYGDAYHVREDGSIIAPYPTKPYDYELLSRNCFICQPAAFMWRDAFVNAGWINEGLQTALDYDLWIRIAKTRPLLKIDGYLATSRLYRENKTVRMRGVVYREIIKVVKAHYGYVPYDWIYGYAAYLIDRKDQIFEISSPTRVKQVAALLGGAYLNWRRIPRFWNEWSTRLGIGVRFTGRWDDGWISKLYWHDLDTAGDCEQIVISGRHLLPFSGGLSLKIRLNGALLRETALRKHGPFKVVLQCPPEARGRLNRLTLECDKILRPIKNGDDRPLSCLIDEITVERGGPGE